MKQADLGLSLTTTVHWNIAMCPGKRKQPDKTRQVVELTDQLKRRN